MWETTLNKASDIKLLYRPVQPTVQESADDLTYTEYLPDLKLQKFIYCYWQFKTDKKLAQPYMHNIVADGCIDVFFELSNPNDSYIMGFCDSFTEFALENSFNYIGIRFLPAMFPQLFKLNAKELSNRFENLENVAPTLSHFIKNNLNPESDFLQIKSVFDNYFIQLVSHTSFDWDKRLYGALQIILKNEGLIDIEKDLNTGISQRQLRRLFEFYVGDTAKTFSKVIRFQNVLKSKHFSQNLIQDKLFFDLGYYDQAHFIKEFKNFYGLTPSKALTK